jgi:outer membrane protein OmpA-like peptidoglycan-associated protein
MWHSNHFGYGATEWRKPFPVAITSMAAIAGLAIVLTPGFLISGCSQFDRASAVASNRATETTAPTQEKISVRGVEFRHDGRLVASSMPVLDTAAAQIKTQPDAEVYVNAYCDPTGGAKLNQRISTERAQAIKAYLEKDGIAPERLIARGFGATDFVANNASANGRLQNRRIELVLVRNQHFAADKPARNRSGGAG